MHTTALYTNMISHKINVNAIIGISNFKNITGMVAQRQIDRVALLNVPRAWQR